MKLTHYHLTTDTPHMDMTLAVVADLHDHPYHAILPILERARPDGIVIPGDLTESLEETYAPHIHRPGLGFLAESAKIAPTFYAFGNHESGACHRNFRHAKTLDRTKKGRVDPSWKEVIKQSGATLLDEAFVMWRGMCIGGLGSGLLNEGRIPNYQWVKGLAAQKGYKILLCHHPEYFDRHLRDLDIDLFVSGHAHGGQWRIFGRGVYAPDQPLVISRGVVNSVKPIPRLGNPCEVVFVHIHSKDTV